MEENYTKGITASDVAKYIGINRSYFYSLFKTYTGHSPTEHLMTLRINKACELLLFYTYVNVFFTKCLMIIKFN